MISSVVKLIYFFCQCTVAFKKVCRTNIIHFSVWGKNYLKKTKTFLPYSLVCDIQSFPSQNWGACLK